MNDKINKLRNTSIYQLDITITQWMARNGMLLMRISIGLIYFWFGILKFFPGISSAEGIATVTISTLTYGIISGSTALLILAVWEVAIGLALIFKIFLRGTLLLMFMQMLGTLTPLFLFPSELFTVFPWVPTLEGQYIIKNLVIISAGIAIGATVRGGKLISETNIAG